MPPRGKGLGLRGRKGDSSQRRQALAVRGRPGRGLLAPAKEQAGPARHTQGQRKVVSGQNPPVLAFKTPAGPTLQNSANAKGAQLSARQAWTNGSRRRGLSQ